MRTRAGVRAGLPDRRLRQSFGTDLRTPLAVQRALIEVGTASSPNDDEPALLTAQLLETSERRNAWSRGCGSGWSSIWGGTA
ncbi:hypothetical protein ACIG87_29200 [Micromonospora sp. NPDC051925]|uniref:hypothetical protein n=1 Tax=Micromonospora sp. NPDC051925 TaxID=3364288 RepID=UPI0037C7C4AE